MNNKEEINNAIEQFIIAVINSGLKYDIYGPHSEIRALPAKDGKPAITIGQYLNSTCWQGKIGMKLANNLNVYHWFKFSIGDYPFLAFDHSYSQVTGKMKSSRAYRHAMRIEKAVEKLIGTKPVLPNY